MTTTTTPEPRVIERIRKLLALANNNSNEEESALAMSRAQQLLAEHNLEMAQLDAQAPSGDGAASRRARVKDKYERSAMFAWQRSLWQAIAESNFCYYQAMPVYKTNTRGVTLKANYHHYIVGSQANVIATKVMGDYLEQTISRLCPFKPGRDSSKSWNSWKEGCAARLATRLADKRRVMERESRERAEAAAAANTQTGLVLSDVYQTEDDLNVLAVYGEEAYERRLATRHDRKTCQCKYCTQNRKWAEQWDAENKAKDEARRLMTPEELAKEEREREARNKRWQDKWDGERQRAHSKTDWDAYYAGAEAGSEIGLDAQVKGKAQGRIG